MISLRHFFLGMLCLYIGVNTTLARHSADNGNVHLLTQHAYKSLRLPVATKQGVLPLQSPHGELRSAPSRTGLSASYKFLSLLSERTRFENLRFDNAASADTAKNYHRLEIFSNSNQEIATVRLTLGETQPVEITAFNILGKRVMDIYNGEARTGVNMVSFDVSQLSHGMYICVVRGQRFKVAEKFLVSR
jgi:hypothetical protein